MPRQKPPEQSHWIVYLMRGRRAERLGTVRARDEADALERAMEEFELQPWQRRRVLVQRENRG